MWATKLVSGRSPFPFSTIPRHLLIFSVTFFFDFVDFQALVLKLFLEFFAGRYQGKYSGSGFLSCGGSLLRLRLPVFGALRRYGLGLLTASIADFRTAGDFA